MVGKRKVKKEVKKRHHGSPPSVDKHPPVASAIPKKKEVASSTPHARGLPPQRRRDAQSDAVRRYASAYARHPHVRDALGATERAPGVLHLGPHDEGRSSLEEGDGEGHLFARQHVCYYGGGLSCVVQSLLFAPMIYFGTEYLFDCAAAPFVPIIQLCAGIIHLFWSLPFSGLFLYAMVRITVHQVVRRRISNVLSPVARNGNILSHIIS